MWVGPDLNSIMVDHYIHSVGPFAVGHPPNCIRIMVFRWVGVGGGGEHGGGKERIQPGRVDGIVVL